MRHYFKDQLEYYPTLTQDIIDRAEYKTVWSGNRLQDGDKIVYAYVYKLNTNDLNVISFLERELDNLGSKFRYIRMEENLMPVLAFNNDVKNKKE
jgi:hypothetical protein